MLLIEPSLRGQWIRQARAALRLCVPVSTRKVSSMQQIDGWIPPTTGPSSSLYPLKVYNSLTRSKTEFVPQQGKRVTWYCCGPTVYDASHMGHARNYVTTDILRRIMTHHFGYDITFVQNVTDIDDKIIVRGRQQYLFTLFSAEAQDNASEADAFAKTAWLSYAAKAATEADVPVCDSVDAFGAWCQRSEVSARRAADAKFGMHISALERAQAALKEAQVSSDDWLSGVRDVVVPLLDKQRGHTVTDPAVFRELAAYWEREFDNDMAKLNVTPPTFVTRVSEYIPEIVDFVEVLVRKGFAYELQGSVYFDIAAYEASGHTYAKLQPWNKVNKELISEGEGSLSTGGSEGKKSSGDFALWKSSKQGEPSWESPWGQGRPGWHIECSVMASAVLGSCIDIHSGGIDLCFPHHDNELAQSEAYHDCPQWVNYFFHSGHLHIEGSKMSKSLKNFITIQEALKMYSARRLRLAFLYAQWERPMDFKEDLIQQSIATESQINKYFTNIKALESEYNAAVTAGRTMPQRYSELEKRLYAAYTSAKDGFAAALADNFDTTSAMRQIEALIRESNVYLRDCKQEYNINLLLDIARWITQQLVMFGLDEPSSSLAIGWSGDAGHGEAGNGDSMQYLRLLSRFRDGVRSASIKKEPPSTVLALCDRLRDVDLLELGVSLNDRESADAGALIKMLSAEEVRDLKARKVQEDEERAQRLAAKQASKAAEEEKRRVQMEAGRLSAREMFAQAQGPEEYAQFDENGVPTHVYAVQEGGSEREVVELNKSRRKKLLKEADAQDKKHQRYLEWKAAGN